MEKQKEVYGERSNRYFHRRILSGYFPSLLYRLGKRGKFTRALTETIQNDLHLKQFFTLLIAELFTLRADCSLCTLKPANPSCFLPPPSVILTDQHQYPTECAMSWTSAAESYLNETRSESVSLCVILKLNGKLRSVELRS